MTLLSPNLKVWTGYNDVRVILTDTFGGYFVMGVKPNAKILTFYRFL